MKFDMHACMGGWMDAGVTTDVHRITAGLRRE